MTRRPGPSAAALAATIALGGCISLFPKETPEDLYRFGGPPTASPGAMNGRFNVLDDTIDFNREASTDEILTVTDNQIAYIKGGRWAETAPTLFHEALQRAFDEAGGPARLIERGQSAKIDQVLRLQVTRFEARYDHGAVAPPTVVVRVRATLSGYAQRNLIGERDFPAEVPASDNRVSAIAAAYDAASGQVISQIVSWVEQAGD